MNGHSYTRSTWCVLLMATILLSACATAPTSTPTSEPIPTLEPTSMPNPTATPIPVTKTSTPSDVPVLSQKPELILATNKPLRKTSYPDHVVYTFSEMDKVLLASELTYYKDLKVDIYYPPGYDFSAKLPIVILAHGFQEEDEFDKDMSQHIDWAKLIAASGMIAVSAQAANAPVENSFHVFEYLGANADVLGLDLTRIGFWACSGQGEPMFKALQDKNLRYRNAFKAAALTYLDFKSADPSLWPKNLSLFVVKDGKDQFIPGSTIDDFVDRARSSDLSIEYVELKDAPHAFDVNQNTQDSKDTIQRILEFFKSKLIP